MQKNIYTTLIGLFSLTTVFAQGFEVKVLEQTRTDYGLAYNFFVGDDVDDFRTTIRGFGSGFLLDAFSGRISKDILEIGTEDVHLTIGAGSAIMKYRFSESVVFSDENNEYSYSLDSDPTHEYGNGFFNNDKSKLVMASFIFPVNLNFDLGAFYISAGGTMDVYLTGKHKLKYTVDGDRVKEVIRNDRFNDFPVNKLKFGLGGMILHKNSGLGVGATYMLTPFFEDNSNFPEMREVRISFSFDMSRFSEGGN